MGNCNACHASTTAEAHGVPREGDPSPAIGSKGKEDEGRSPKLGTEGNSFQAGITLSKPLMRSLGY